jgi:hypothetical protein
MGLAEIPSYWKAACPPTIAVEAGYLDKTQIAFWQDLIFNMGQFFYENKLPFIKPKFKIIAAKPKTSPVIKNKFAENFLVPLGGGKDSLVSLELVRGAQKKTKTFTLNANNALKKVVGIAGAENIFIERVIDKKLIELKRRGYLNGHTPFSAILAVLGTALAAIFDCEFVAISQECSSDEGNVEYLGKTVNHQYSKSFEFENKFREYSKKYLAKNIVFFSFLRPLHEIQIAEIFSRYPKYFPYFLSCNKSFTIAARESEADTGWCGKCSKCLSVYAMLYPFIGKESAVKIFGKDLFDDRSLLPLMLELCGRAGCKPFECVGTLQETLAAFCLSLAASGGQKPYLLDYFKENILGANPDIKAMPKMIFASWNKKHNIPKDLAAILKDAAVPDIEFRSIPPLAE